MQSVYLFVPRFPPISTALLVAVLLAPAPARPQHEATVPDQTDQRSRRIHLILRDGTFQLVTDYRVSGENVIYHSAERAGAEEVVPAALVDLDATRLWQQRHERALGGNGANIPGSAPNQPPPLDPELLKEEADRASLTPEVAPNLRLPEQDSVLALDTFQGAPELLPLAQTEGELNRNTAHAILRSAINPLSSPHPVITLHGPRSAVQLHIPDPVFYVRLGDDTDTPASGTALTIDTHGASGNAPSAQAGGSTASRYVVVRTDVRIDVRVIQSFSLSSPQDGRPLPEDVIPVTAVGLPGGHWTRLTPARALDFGEFALVEILDAKHLNTSVWDFGVHPAAPEFRDAIKPRERRLSH